MKAVILEASFSLQHVQLAARDVTMHESAQPVWNSSSRNLPFSESYSSESTAWQNLAGQRSKCG
eukprot:scaffold306136_cov41-Prasinocladus_malaysianus.AAC.1